MKHGLKAGPNGRPRARPGSGLEARPRHGRSAVETALLAVIVGLIGFVGWYVWQSKRQSDTVMRQAEAVIAADRGAARPLAPVTTESAAGGFSIVFPDGWNVMRPKDSDRFVIPGQDQPEFKPGRRAMVTDVAAGDGGGGGAAVFSAVIGNGFEPPEGQATDFVFGSGRDLLSGHKVTHEYEEDTTAGGVERSRGDVDYTYVFALGGSDGKRELRVRYSVFASDPRDNVDRVDDVVRSIRVKR